MFDEKAAQNRLQRGDLLKNQVYPLQDRIIHCIRELNLPFYLTGATALNRFILSGRYTRDLEYQVDAEKNFANLAERAAQAMCAEFSQGREKILCMEKSETLHQFEIHSVGNMQMHVSFVNGPPYHVNGALPGGLFNRPECGKLDYWLNILTDIVAREANRTPEDAADLWWMAVNYQIDWPEIVAFARRKNPGVRVPAVTKNLEAVSETSLSEIPWVIDRTPTTVHAQLKIIAEDISQNRPNSLAPEPFDEH